MFKKKQANFSASLFKIVLNNDNYFFLNLKI